MGRITSWESLETVSVMMDDGVLYTNKNTDANEK